MIVQFPMSVRWVRQAGGARSHALRWTGERWVPLCSHVNRRGLVLGWYRLSQGLKHCQLCERRLARLDKPDGSLQQKVATR